MRETVWIVGASSGIGRAVALRYAGREVNLALTGRRAEKLTELSKEIGSLSNGKTQVGVFPADLNKRELLPPLIEEIQRALGPVTTLIYSAGTYISSDTSVNFSPDEYVEQMRINYFGLLYAIESVLPQMLSIAKRKDSSSTPETTPLRIVGVSSLIGYRGMPLAAGYSASKGAVINFLQSLRFELKRVGITVQIVNPGFVKTPLTDKNTFKMPFLISAEEAAEIITQGIDRGVTEIHFPKKLSYIFKILRILPYSLYEWCMEKQVYGRDKTNRTER